jgi:hypothetical protein
MSTTNDLPPDQTSELHLPIFLGNLELIQTHRGSYLVLTHFCPACRQRHSHEWGFDHLLQPKIYPVEPTPGPRTART